ncbi:hypothetical protein J4461_00460 [Candidatus Pacearchaeota archaeon]|nr:hypothetical protein [Candidatus Pacearchaeota archaeon]
MLVKAILVVFALVLLSGVSSAYGFYEPWYYAPSDVVIVDRTPSYGGGVLVSDNSPMYTSIKRTYGYGRDYYSDWGCGRNPCYRQYERRVRCAW